MDRNFVDSIIGNFGLIQVLEKTVDKLETPDANLLKAFIKATTDNLSDEDLDALVEIVVNNYEEEQQ